MNTFLTYEEIVSKCEKLNDIYEIEEDKFYRIVENWSDRDVSTDSKLLATYKELLQVVSNEVESMEQAVEMSPTCRLGCAFCCYFPIIINGMEAKLIKEAISHFPKSREEGIKQHLANYYDKYSDEIEQITRLDFENDPDFKYKYKKSNIPCPMLNTETNQCMAYELRPIPCRTYVNYTNPKICEEEVMPKETISYEFLYSEYMGALNEFLQFLYEEGDTSFIEYPNDVYEEDYLANWLKELVIIEK
ncbi:YkgJ family cysteine cluster protein [Aquibacillus kalidii]|uniref:YkgJ family cysteine cluster protein n=1 Tax=Aquibacillus kalidii TaxID=2762597 RepID=UPI001644C735|nr:YkgJ family cysteine cluster protein [Aquibacillus kalidii]